MRRDNGLSPEFFLCDATLLLARPGAVAVLTVVGGGGGYNDNHCQM